MKPLDLNELFESRSFASANITGCESTLPKWDVLMGKKQLVQSNKNFPVLPRGLPHFSRFNELQKSGTLNRSPNHSLGTAPVSQSFNAR
jgi:hypothetical protein